MFLDVITTVIVCVAINYLMMIPVFYFILNERITNIDNLIASRSPRKRVDLAKTRNGLKRDKIMALLWPVLFIKGANGRRKKK